MSGGGGSSGGNQVTRVEPPSYQLPHLQAGLNQAQTLYNQGPTVVPFSPQTEQALQLTQNRALAGSPVTRSAQDYATKSLGGGFLGSNPYLDATFQQAALGTQNQLASEFARSGRNIDASMYERSGQLNNLATQIYGGAYENERNRQQAVLPFATGLADADYNDYSRLAGVGSAVEGLAQQYADAPGRNLDQYLGRVSGSQYGQTTTAPGQRSNPLAGAAGGALAAYGLGTSGIAGLSGLAGPWGLLGGAVLGGLLS